MSEKFERFEIWAMFISAALPLCYEQKVFYIIFNGFFYSNYYDYFCCFARCPSPPPPPASTVPRENFSGKNGHIAPVRLWYLIKIDVFSRHKHDEYKQSRVLSLTIDLSMHIVLICTSVRCMNECNYDTHACICAKWQQKCHYFDRDIEVEHLHYKYV